ncbi:MAG: hypothetical protein LBW85_04850 [Deltaproteobacteria bacterium]|jgi:hypothetical protein|nr:hypothetical protein [Deltaproteobacteria bacterium]
MSEISHTYDKNDNLDDFLSIELVLSGINSMISIFSNKLYNVTNLSKIKEKYYRDFLYTLANERNLFYNGDISIRAKLLYIYLSLLKSYLK